MPLPRSVLLVLAACGGSSSPPDAPPDGFDRNAMLAHVATNVLLPIQTAAKDKAALLPAAIDAHCDGLEAGGAGSIDTARAAWRDAIDAWERAEALLVGPAAMDQKTLRDRIYGWPLLSTCSVDRDTASRFADPASYDISTRLVNARSLLAIEYLLHATDTNHTCAATPAGWDALGANLPLARCRLAEAIAIDVAAQTVALEAAWRPDGGDFVGELANAGRDGSTIASAQEAVNRVSDGLFYVDRMVKDMKVAEAAGIAINSCGAIGTVCVQEVELRFSDRATFAIRTNLVALREGFTGQTATADGSSFDDFLREVGHPEVADRMIANLDAAIAKANALPDSFLTALANNRDQVAETHAAIALFTDDLKSQFLTLLGLEIPDDVATDND